MFGERDVGFPRLLGFEAGKGLLDFAAFGEEGFGLGSQIGLLGARRVEALSQVLQPVLLPRNFGVEGAHLIVFRESVVLRPLRGALELEGIEPSSLELGFRGVERRTSRIDLSSGSTSAAGQRGNEIDPAARQISANSRSAG